MSLVIAGSLAGTTTDLRTGRIVLALHARSGKTFAIAKRNQPRKISHVADAVETPGIYGTIDRCCAIPMSARTAATVKSQTFGARRFVFMMFLPCGFD